MPTRRTLVLLLLLTGAAVARNLAPGDLLPDVSRIPLAPMSDAYVPKAYGDPSLEPLLPADGLLILHFSAPRPPRHQAFKLYFTEELAALRKAALSTAYPCSAIAVLPFGGKAREDAKVLLDIAAKERTLPWGGGVPVYYEPTFPRPGLFLTLRPDDAAITTPCTYLIGPDRRLLAIRESGDGNGLYDWLQENLPDRLQPPPGKPVGDAGLPEDAPETWPAFRRTLAGRAVADRVPDRLPYTYLAWDAAIGPTFASPAVADGVVYAATDAKGLVNLNFETGEQLAAAETGGSWWTSPAVAGELVYTASDAGVVTALDRESLEPRWSRNLGGLITSSPTVAAGRLIVGSRNGGVYALDALTGDTLWVFQTGGEVSSSPVPAGGAVLIGSGDRHLYALDLATGQPRWSAATQAAVDSSPTVADESVLVGSFDGGLYSFALADGKQNWRCELGGWVHSSPAVAGQTVFAGSVRLKPGQKPLFAWVDLASGKLLGSHEMPDSVYSSPVVWDELVLVGCRDHLLYAFDRDMKRTDPLWSFTTKDHVHATPVVVGDTVLVASYDGHLYALRQAKPIGVWGQDDLVPRWFMAAMVKQLHEETGKQIAAAATGEVGQERSLTAFAALFDRLKAQAAQPARVEQALPSDVPPDHPGAPYVGYALASGLLGGYPDGTFHPSDPCSRYQLASALGTTVEAIGKPDFVWRSLRDREGTPVTVEVQLRGGGRRPVLAADVPEQHWAYKALADMARRGLLPLDDENRFRGQRQVTLKDAAEQWGLLVDSVKVVRTR
ncbi:MAG: PQQ-binding-like beta-propeller repeat protein [Armatimonadetes bacterium]|nr:PQQ-binding-like beta-propeller repeat protein [Armatimonadota bacterium]